MNVDLDCAEIFWIHKSLMKYWETMEVDEVYYMDDMKDLCRKFRQLRDKLCSQ